VRHCLADAYLPAGLESCITYAMPGTYRHTEWTRRVACLVTLPPLRRQCYRDRSSAVSSVLSPSLSLHLCAQCYR
jgi:hypothetical protein